MEQAASSTLSRRGVLGGVASLAIAAIVATTAFRPAVGDRARRVLAGNSFTRRFLSLANAEQAEWQAQVGSDLTVEGGYTIRLAGVRPLTSLGERPASVTRERAFAAVFDVRGGATMAGDLIYTVTHPQYGVMPVFLSATGTARRMQAVFN
jgi:hypothetical protein